MAAFERLRLAPRRIAQPARPSGVPPAAVWLGLGVAASVLFGLLGSRRSEGRTVEDVMISDVLAIDSSATLTEAAEHMRRGNVGVLPVLEGGRLVGLITDRDLVVRAVANGMTPSATRVSECMTRDVRCARPDWSIEEARGTMTRNRIGRLPVVNERDHVIGMVTLSSLALRSHEEGEALHAAQEVSRRSARAATR